MSDWFVSCSLFHCYIKPQPLTKRHLSKRVVPYSIATSNHNRPRFDEHDLFVVPYSIATSNHNSGAWLFDGSCVVPYSIATSNHNRAILGYLAQKLFLIPLLHQTTTDSCTQLFPRPLFLIPLLHQTTTLTFQYAYNEYIACVETTKKTRILSRKWFSVSISVYQRSKIILVAKGLPNFFSPLSPIC